MSDSNQKIVFTSSEPSLAVVYDTKTGLHSVYKIRKASAEERQIVCGGSDSSSSVYNHSTSASPLHISANKSCSTKALSLFGTSSSRCSSNNCTISAVSVTSNSFLCSEFSGVPNLQLSGVSMGLGLGSPFGSRGTSYTTSCSGGGPSPSQAQHASHSRSQSPMATISRCQSPTHSAFSPLLAASIGGNIHQTRLHHTVMATMHGQSQHSPSSCNSIQFQDAPNAMSKPLYPEICLDHVWTENVGVPKYIINY